MAMVKDGNGAEINASKNGLFTESGAAIRCECEVSEGGKYGWLHKHRCTYQAAHYAKQPNGTNKLMCNRHYATLVTRRERQDAKRRQQLAADRQVAQTEQERRADLLSKLQAAGFVVRDYDIKIRFSDVTLPLGILNELLANYAAKEEGSHSEI